MNRFAWQIVICVAALPLLQSCITAQQTTRAAILPLAAVGDTVVAPFQACGKASRSMIAAGNERTRQSDQSRDTVGDAPRSRPNVPLKDGVIAWMYYVPGYALLPCDMLTPERYYGHTQDCLRDMRSENATPAKTP